MSSKSDSLCNSFARCLLGHSAVCWSTQASSQPDLGLNPPLYWSHIVPSVHCAPAILPSCLSISTSSYPASGPLHRQFPLPRALHPHPRADHGWLLSRSVSPALCLALLPSAHLSLLEMILFMCSLLFSISPPPVECIAHERRDCVWCSHLYHQSKGCHCKYL